MNLRHLAAVALTLFACFSTPGQARDLYDLEIEEADADADRPDQGDIDPESAEWLAWLEDCQEQGLVIWDGDYGVLIANPTVDDCLEDFQSKEDWCEGVAQEEFEECVQTTQPVTDAEYDVCYARKAAKKHECFKNS